MTISVVDVLLLEEILMEALIDEAYARLYPGKPIIATGRFKTHPVIQNIPNKPLDKGTKQE